MTDSPPQRKRSRFDQTEPEPKRTSRFDRRSRSPATRPSESHRSRSPTTTKEDSPAGVKSPSDATARAAAAAARIAAQVQAKKGIQHVDVPPIRSTASPGTPVTPSTPKPAGSSVTTSNIGGDIYIADGDYIKDIEINDLRNRYTLTKGATQKMIKEETGADVTTRGSYLPDKTMATPTNPPLYLHITSTSKTGLEKAVAKIEDMMQQELPNLVDERRFRRREPEQVERDEFGRRKWPEERISIDIEPLPGFNLRAQVVGQGGAYVKHIQAETRCRVQIKGRGSGFVERDTNQESDEPMYLHVTGPDPKEVERAKELCEDLLTNVRQHWQEFKNNPPQRNYDRGGGYGQRDQSGTAYGGYGSGGGGGATGYGGYGSSEQSGYGGAGGYGRQSSYAGASSSHGGGQASYAGYGSVQSPPGAQASPAPGANGVASPTAGSQDQYAQWSQWAAQNPEAAQWYQQYYQYYQQTGQTPTQPLNAPGQQQPPPPAGTSPGAAGGYNAVPPPPGM